MRGLLITLGAVFFLSACKSTKVIEVPVETVRKEYVHDTRIDSVYIRDSIDRWQKGDTLYINRWYTKYKYINRTDTVVVTDSVPKVVVVEKEVKVNRIYWWQKSLMWLGAIVTLCGMALLGYKLKKVL